MESRRIFELKVFNESPRERLKSGLMNQFGGERGGPFLNYIPF